ncbi:acetate/propionate family kinase [Thermomonas sp.]|jgi:acetate kinase|uniref:acetate/propionate family kinase n=1 Tax=Thermomonas sp. TaxID=1971895 RepID=UPI002486E37A|nr:acetate/propionate family kinase [Thermomonas sp.]MDI1252509.1 acetate/propionate family kinase [Thermomonas sp.]
MSDDVDRPILALNVGSSSLKFGLFIVGASGNRVMLSGAEGAVGNPQEALARIAQQMWAHGLPAPVAVGHRIVHGGPQCRQHTLIDAEVMQQLQAATSFAPLHLPPALALVRAAQARFTGIAQVACLDTAFHAGMPDVARTLPIPSELRALGIERYGFHGLSGESVIRQLGSDVPPRLVIAHLGHGASVTAVAHGSSVDTSMGFTPTGGVIMSTRCGDIDPGVLAYMVREHGYDADQLEALIDQRSGMFGISGISGDMRELRAAAASTYASGADARLAIAMFCASVRKQIAAMAAVLGGVDSLVFTGGIGENDALTRATICKGLESLGIPTSQARVMPAREEEQIAWRTRQLT